MMFIYATSWWHGISLWGTPEQNNLCGSTEHSLGWLLKEEKEYPGSLLTLSILLTSGDSDRNITKITVDCSRSCTAAKKLFPTSTQCYHCVYMCVYNLLNNSKLNAHKYVKYIKPKSIIKFEQSMRKNVIQTKEKVVSSATKNKTAVFSSTPLAVQTNESNGQEFYAIF